MKRKQLELHLSPESERRFLVALEKSMRRPEDCAWLAYAARGIAESVSARIGCGCPVPKYFWDVLQNAPCESWDSLLMAAGAAMEDLEDSLKTDWVDAASKHRRAIEAALNMLFSIRDIAQEQVEGCA